MELLESKTLLSGAHVDVLRRTYRRADGRVVSRDVIHHPGSVAIVAHDAEVVHLVAQPREAVEEARLRAEHWSVLQVLYPSPGILDERVTIFEATGLSPASGERDDDEQIEIVRLPLAELPSALPEIRSALTLIGLLTLLARAAQQP